MSPQTWTFANPRPGGTRPPRILFLPEIEDPGTSERTPMLRRLLREHHEVLGLRFPLGRLVYDTSRPKVPRYLLYVVDEALGALRGLRLARAHRLQLAFCETPHHALVGLWIARVLGLRCVWDSHGNALLFAKSVGKGKVYTFLSSALDRFLARRVDFLITVTERDADAYVAMGVRRSRIQVVPTSVALGEVDRLLGSAPGPVPSEGRKRLLFFGSFKYAPNLDSFRFINDQLAPYLEKEGLSVEIQIAGRDLPQDGLHPSVRPLGFVENLPGCIRDADLCVVPVWNGVGILTKLVDIMAAGTPAVVTEFAASGIPELHDGVHARIARSPREFCELVTGALRHPATMRAMADNARRLVQERYDWGVQAPRLERLLESLVYQAGG